MLAHPTLDQLRELNLDGMIKAINELEASDQVAELSHLEWLGLALEREISHRRDKRLAMRLRYAKLRHLACIEDVDYHTPRGLDVASFVMLAHVCGSRITKIYSFAENPVSAKVGYLVF